MTGVLCLEADWFGYRDPSTVRPLLEIVSHGVDRKVTIVHRGVSTREELEFHLRRWRRAERLSVLFLAAHGAPGYVFLESSQRKRCAVDLDELAEMIGPSNSRKLVHFGCCSTLGVDKRHVVRFLNRTGALAVTGFTEDLPWLRSAALELLVLSTMVRFRATPDGVRRMRRAILCDVPGLRKELGLRVVLRCP